MHEEIDQIVKHYSSLIQDEHIFFHPNIPSKKLHNALKAYAAGVQPQDVLILIDNTAWGKAKNGGLLTVTEFYAHNILQKPKHVTLTDIDSISFKAGKMDNEIYINRMSFLSTAQPSTESMALFTHLLEEVVVACSRNYASEDMNAVWANKHQIMVKSLDTISHADLTQVMRDLDLLVSKIGMARWQRAQDLIQRL
jgi:hypothetical protein